MYKNSFAPIIGAAVSAAQSQIQGATGAGSVFQEGVTGGSSPPGNLTYANPETGETMWGFMIGVDGIGDQNATFIGDGRLYEFGS